MKRKHLLLTLFAATLPLWALAYDFSAVAPSGQTLYYNIVNGEAQVTPQYSVPGTVRYTNYPTGDLTIPDTVAHGGVSYAVTSIDDWTFQLCYNLSSVVIPATVSRIGDHAFGACTTLTSIVFPSYISSLGKFAFFGCYNLSSVIFQNGVGIIGDQLFALAPPCAVAYVPCNEVAACLADSLWNASFSDVRGIGCPVALEATPSDPAMGTVLGSGTYPEGDTAVLAAVPQRGFVFDGWSNGATDNPYPLVVTSDTSLTALFAPKDTLFVHDTTVVHDTMIAYLVHIADTALVTRYIYDSTTVNNTYYDTFYVFTHVVDTMRILDTVIVNHFQYDTVIRNVCQYDTTIVNNYAFDTSIYNSFRFDTTLVFDTMIVNFYTFDTAIYNRYQFDTTLVNVYRYDTTLVNVYDTTIVNIYDTTISNRYQYDTVVVNNYYYDTVRLHYYDTVNNYYYDTVIVSHYYHDTVLVNNYIYDTIYLNRYIFDTVYIHDTVYVTDQQGIDDAVAVNAKIYQRGGRVVVEGAEGHEVVLYDAVGRQLATRRDEGHPLAFEVPASGAYLVRIGQAPARRIVVVR